MYTSLRVYVCDVIAAYGRNESMKIDLYASV